MPAEGCDVAVVGLGAMGSMALWRLAARGVRCIGLDRHSPPHAFGSSHGESRIFRTAYAEGAFYVPLLVEALSLWRELAAATGEELITMTGAAMIGPLDGEVVRGALTSAREHGLAHQILDAPQAAARLPQHVISSDDAALIEEGGGVLRPERCIAAALTLATQDGATVCRDDAVDAIEPSGDDGVQLSTAAGRVVRADSCIVAAGAWTGRLLPVLRDRLEVERQVMVWLRLGDPTLWMPSAAPVWIRELGDRRLRYGFPTLDSRSVKLAVHHEGAPADPDSLDRVVDDSDLEGGREMARRWLRGVDDVVIDSAVCMYTNTPDEHLLVGGVPGMRNVVVLGGCSGHSFKLAPILGDVAAELALNGRTTRDVAALAPTRPALHLSS